MSRRLAVGLVVAAFVLGAIIGSEILPVGRYELGKHGEVLIKMDTATGAAWVLRSGAWVRLGDGPGKLKGETNG